MRRADEKLSAMSAYLSNQDSMSSIQGSAEAILRAVTEVSFTIMVAFVMWFTCVCCCPVVAGSGQLAIEIFVRHDP